MMAFTVSPAIMCYTNCIIKSPGSAIRPAFGLLLETSLIVTLVWTWLRTLQKNCCFAHSNNSHSSLLALVYDNVQHKAAVVFMNISKMKSKCGKNIMV